MNIEHIQNGGSFLAKFTIGYGWAMFSVGPPNVEQFSPWRTGALQLIHENYSISQFTSTKN